MAQIQPLIHIAEDPTAPLTTTTHLRRRRVIKKNPIDIRNHTPVQNIITQTTSNEQSRDLRSKSHRQTPGHRSVSLFWSEKLRILFDTFQLLGILWTSYQSWPAVWIVATQWTSLFSGDVLSLIEYHSLLLPDVLPSNWNEAKSNYFALYLPVVVIFLPLLLWSFRKFCCCCASSKKNATSIVLRISECIYMPVSLCLFELITCRGRIDAWYTSPNQAFTCWGWFGTHTSEIWYSYVYVYAIPIVSVIVGVIFLCWVPLTLASIVRTTHVYSDPIQHEVYVNTKELEYLLYVNTDYEDENFDTTSSYKRHAMHQKERILWLKLLLVLSRVLLVGFNCETWSMLVLGPILLLWVIVQTLSPVYRVWSSNVIHLSLTWMVVGIAALGALRQRGMYAALISDVTVVPMLLVVSSLGIVLGSLLFGIILPLCWNHQWPIYQYCINHENEQSKQHVLFHTDGIEFVPPRRSLNRYCRSCISCYHHVAQHHVLYIGRNDKYSHVQNWMVTLGESQDILLECHFILKEFLPLDRLNNIIEKLRTGWLKALTRNHILKYTLRDHLEELVALTKGVASKHSLYARKELGLKEIDIVHFSDMVNNNERDRILMDPRIRRALKKLVAMRMWIGNRKIETLEIEENDHPFHLVPGPTDILTNLSKTNGEKDLYYVLSFRGGPLYIDIAPGEKDEIEVDGFIVPSNGKPGPAEKTGIIEEGDVIVAINGTNLCSLNFDDGLDVFADATWPRMIIFQRPIDGIPKVRKTNILNEYLELTGSLMNAATNTNVTNESTEELAMHTPRGANTISNSGETKSNNNAVINEGERKENNSGISNMLSWKDMLHAHTNDSMSLDETLEAVSLMEHAKMSHESVSELEKRLLFFIKSWEDDFSNHHDGKVLTDEDRLEIKEWYQAMHFVKQRLSELVVEESQQ